MIDDLLPYLIVFGASCLVTLVLTPFVRELFRTIGMVDKPDPRRINKVPIPRGGGLAIVIGVLVPYFAFHLVTGRPFLQGLPDAMAYKMALLSVVMALIGLVDDRFSLSPKLKLLGQVAVAILVWGWAGLGFQDMWPQLPQGLDGVLTVLWIVGAVNAFNLIDGLDGLATGLALIATIGMAGSLFFVRNPQMTFFYLAFAGGLLGFLRYNYNPASVFLGDCGSMFIGFNVCTLPLAAHESNSFLVSVGMPLLAMGVPIFDTSLAILRRLLRKLLQRGNKSGEVMTADSDHLHHRILRSVGFNQRKAAWTLYGLAMLAVSFGLVGMSLKSRSAGLWLVALAVAAVVIFKDAYIEMFDAGRYLNQLAHSRTVVARRRLERFSVPFWLCMDLLLLAVVFLLCAWTLRMRMDLSVLRNAMLVRIVATFGCLVFFRVYHTAWSRALASNFFRLLLACVFGSIIGSVFIYYWPTFSIFQIKAMTLSYAFVSFATLFFLRMARGLVRDLFYAIDCSRLLGRKDVSRVLVYGAGLRYRAFRRELVRTTSANDRIIVGILDDDVLLKGKYIGGLQVCGTINDAPAVINRLNVDTVVIACEIEDRWLKVVKEILVPTGVKIRLFSMTESEISGR